MRHRLHQCLYCEIDYLPAFDIFIHVFHRHVSRESRQRWSDVQEYYCPWCGEMVSEMSREMGYGELHYQGCAKRKLAQISGSLPPEFYPPATAKKRIR